MRKVKLLICITTLTCIILGCQPKPDYSEQEKLIHQYFTYVKYFDVDGLKTVIYNEGSSLYDPNILYDIYDIYEDYVLSDFYEIYYKEYVDEYFATYAKEFINSYEIKEIDEYEYKEKDGKYYIAKIDATKKKYSKMPGYIDHFSIYRSELKKNHEEELEKIYNEQGYEAVDAYVNTQCLKTYFNDALEKIKSTPYQTNRYQINN